MCPGRTHYLRSTDVALLRQWRYALHRLMPHLQPCELKAGWLLKRGGGGSSSGFRRRWCVLYSSHRLVYFDDETKRKKKGTVDLKMSDGVRSLAEADGNNGGGGGEQNGGAAAGAGASAEEAALEKRKEKRNSLVGSRLSCRGGSRASTAGGSSATRASAARAGFEILTTGRTWVFATENDREDEAEGGVAAKAPRTDS